MTTPQQKKAPAILALSALGIVFGDIGTSPLYTFNSVLKLAGGTNRPEIVLGLLSLLFWTLVLVTSIKYALFAMRIDNRGEGGILALMSLLVKFHSKRQRWIIAAGLLGAAFIYGDGVITPAISVLSALEGLELALPTTADYILPLTMFILILLFSIQPLGTARISRFFAPVMIVWFSVLALLGIRGIMMNPYVLLALNPLYALEFFIADGLTSFLVLGGVFLCVTGAEALYADMGHFGRKPIWIAWYTIALPSLVLNYAGQAALILSGADVSNNIFYRLCPPSLQMPLVILSTLATIIASQAIITGAFSMTRQAIQLGWLPRMKIKQTTEDSFGQIYIGTINWLLMVVTLTLVMFFQSSERLAAAYGIAVSLTMLMTSFLLYSAMRQIWRWNRVTSLSVAGIFILIDTSFTVANTIKIIEGGYVPLLLAMLIFAVMFVWRQGVNRVARTVAEKNLSVEDFLSSIEDNGIARVPGVGVFLTRTQGVAPPVMRWHVKRNQSLHDKIIALTIQVLDVPRVSAEHKLDLTEKYPGFWQGVAYYGFMEKPNVPELLKNTSPLERCPDHESVTYYIGHESIVAKESRDALPRWQSHTFAWMVRNCLHITEHYQLPGNQVIEIGRRIAI
ncbi:potassium transporter Kup [Musicola paradisiaca]|uniref:Low affinity potassium transport system protein Kup n=1 Tax=Musicola paradisiaca (strain Ech703) TaxID=579405 RepID=C6C567_MUSP7|nr:KUP/HAK/KT family potassium transporter [Musicola paradisiaca]ACS85677.1 K potassium transporter [Musicola paradisiaca Ech703]